MNSSIFISQAIYQGGPSLGAFEQLKKGGKNTVDLSKSTRFFLPSCIVVVNTVELQWLEHF